MKSVLLAASAAVLLCATPAAYAQSQGPTYDNTIHQSAGDRDSRGLPKYYKSGREGRYHRQASRLRRHMAPSTTGQGNGPYYENTIHQSAGDRDARGLPKYNQR